jgi:hypothetical protein
MACLRSVTFLMSYGSQRVNTGKEMCCTWRMERRKRRGRSRRQSDKWLPAPEKSRRG